MTKNIMKSNEVRIIRCEVKSSRNTRLQKLPVSNICEVHYYNRVGMLIFLFSFDTQIQLISTGIFTTKKTRQPKKVCVILRQIYSDTVVNKNIVRITINLKE